MFPVSISVNFTLISVIQIPQHLSSFHNDAVGERTCCSLCLMLWLSLCFSFLESLNIFCQLVCGQKIQTPWTITTNSFCLSLYEWNFRHSKRFCNAIVPPLMIPSLPLLRNLLEVRNALCLLPLGSSTLIYLCPMPCLILDLPLCHLLDG